jgi:hypothetical protein
MADEQPTTEFEPVVEASSATPSGGEGGQSPAGGQSPLGVGSEEDAFAERPEAFVGAAFAGGLALALILRRLTR